jgi:hypothetical protein
VGGLLIPLDGLIAVLLLALLAFAGLAVRRALLARPLGSFECALRHETIRHLSPWSAGVARFGDDRLEWFRFFGAGFRATETLMRHRLMIIERRDPLPHESYAVLTGWVVVRCGYGGVIVELAMSDPAYNGLSAWLESAPPGQHINVA